MMVVLPVLMMLMFMVLVMPVAVLAGLLMMVMMIFVYHSSVYFPTAKVRRSGCNRVALFARNG